jgi:hexokinase
MDKIIRFLTDTGIIINSENHPFIIEQFISEMQRGLAGKTSSLKMIPSHYSARHHLSRIPVIVIDAGGTRLRTGLFTVNPQNIIIIKRYQETVLPGIREEVEKEFFFDVIANQIEPLAHEADRIGFCFSYPMEQLVNLDGKVINLTKEIKINNIVGENIGANLKKSLLRKNISVKKIAVLNDTIATLLAGIDYKQSPSFPSNIGLVAGTGTNIAYVENNADIKKIDTDHGFQIINCESGGFDKFTTSEIDTILDKKSDNPGFQKLEKTVSGRYLGNLVHLTLKYLSTHRLISDKLSSFTENVPRINTEDISDWIRKRDKSQNIFSETLYMTNISKFDQEQLLAIINHIINRSAQLTALCCCAIILKKNLGSTPQTPARIIYEGSLIKHFPAYLKKFQHTLNSSLEKHGEKHLKIFYTKNPSLKGSGLAAHFLD